MRILAIQSQVIHGHVGNNAGVFPMQRQGADVWAMPTAVLAFNPSYGPPAMRPSEPAEIDAWVAALQTRPEWKQIDAVLLGWLGNARTAEAAARRSEEHTSELQSLMRISYAVFCLQKKKKKNK